MANAIGRIPGTQLNDNLIRNGIDLTFKNQITDDGLLHLDVTNDRIGINREVPVYDLDVNGTTRTTYLEADNQARFGNIIFDDSGVITTKVGPIHIKPEQDSSWPPIIEYEHSTTDLLDFRYNKISTTVSNSDIILDTLSPAKVVFNGNTFVNGDTGYGNLSLTGTITVDGNLTTFSNIIIGNEVYEPDTGVGDTVEVNTDFTQDILPGDDNKWELGADGRLDSSPQRWKKIWSEDVQDILDIGTPVELRFNNGGLVINGVTNRITVPQNTKRIVHVELANPVRIVTLVDHGFRNAQKVQIRSTGVTQLDNNIYYVKIASDDEVDLYADPNLIFPINGAGYTGYPSSGGTIDDLPDDVVINSASGYITVEDFKIRDNSSAPISVAHVELTNPVRVVTVTDHNFINNQLARILNTGVIQLDGKDFYIRVVSYDEVELYSNAALTVPINGAGYSAYPSGGGTIQGYTEIRNLSNNPVTFASTGSGYWNFTPMTAGIVIPVGTSAQRPVKPEVGLTRWNTDEEYLECFDGNSYVIATGGGAEVTQSLMQEIADIWALTLG